MEKKKYRTGVEIYFPGHPVQTFVGTVMEFTAEEFGNALERIVNAPRLTVSLENGSTLIVPRGAMQHTICILTPEP